jgi:cytochrome c5
MTRSILPSVLALGLAAAPLAAQAKTIALPKSVEVQLPAGTEPFDGPGADAINNNCLTCHSRGMVLNQPAMPQAAWQAEVAKMRNVYKAPVNEADVPAIVDYLVRVKGAK